MDAELDSFKQLLAEIAESKETPHVSRLIHLSGLDREELALFKELWPKLSRERQRETIAKLLNLAEVSLEVSFDPVFRVSLESPDEDVKFMAIAGLHQSEDYSLIGPLVRLLETDSSEKVRAAAATALGGFALLAELGKLRSTRGENVYSALLKVLEEGRETVLVKSGALDAIAVFSRPRVRELIEQAYTSSEPDLRAAAVCAMGHNCDPAWLPAITRELASDRPAMRCCAASAAGEVGVKAAVPSLVPLTRDENLNVREAAIKALGEIGGDEAKEALGRLLKSSVKRVREAAQTALVDLVFWEDPGAYRRWQQIP